MLNEVRVSRSFTSLPPIHHLLKHMLDGVHHHGEKSSMSITTRDSSLPAGRSNAEQLHLSWNRTPTLQMYALLFYRM